jgi:hypothetical protein
LQSSGASAGNCFAGNTPRRTQPNALERRTRCGESTAIDAIRLQPLRAPPQVDHRTVPAPPRQPSMPRADTAHAQPATGHPEEQ